jgi:hypothetical protein
MLQEQSGIEVDGDIVQTFLALLARAAETRATIKEAPATTGWSSDVSATATQMADASPLAATV